MTDTAVRTGLSIKAGFFVLNWVMLFFRPVIVVNGAEQKGSWGDNFLSLHPGRHAVEVYFKYIVKCGKASTIVLVRDGEAARLRYRAPLFAVLPGKLTVV